MNVNAHFLFGKTQGVDTPLAAELRHGDDCDIVHLKLLLDDGAAQTVKKLAAYHQLHVLFIVQCVLIYYFVV